MRSKGIILLKVRRSVIVISTLMILLTACSSNQTEQNGQQDDEQTAQDKQEADPVFKDAETLIKEFVKRAQKGDLEQLETLFAIEEHVEGYDEALDEDGIFQPVNYKMRRLFIYEEIFQFYHGLQYKNFDQMRATIDINNPSESTELTLDDLLSAEKYKDLEVVQIDLPELKQEEHEKRIAMVPVSKKTFSAEGWDYRTTLLSLDGTTYYCGFVFTIYDGNYYLSDFTCPMVPMTEVLATVPCTEEEYPQLIQRLNE